MYYLLVTKDFCAVVSSPELDDCIISILQNGIIIREESMCILLCKNPEEFVVSSPLNLKTGSNREEHVDGHQVKAVHV
jgi:hypothetical protein